jgi:aldehyde dehydrogenase (NAD+)
MGKSLQEGYGEVQEMIDILRFAVGLSRQLHGLTMHSERPGHRMYEQYQPMGVVGIISAFNLPVAVWAWNTALAWMWGCLCLETFRENTTLWNSLSKYYCRSYQRKQSTRRYFCLINGDYKVGEMMTSDKRVPLISATGSTRMGKIVNSRRSFRKIIIRIRWKQCDYCNTRR